MSVCVSHVWRLNHESHYLHCESCFLILHHGTGVMTLDVSIVSHVDSSIVTYDLSYAARLLLPTWASCGVFVHSCVCVRVCLFERGREKEFVWERESECVYLCVCVCVRVRQRQRQCQRQRQRQRQHQRQRQRQRQCQRQRLCRGYNMRQKMYIKTYTVRHGSMTFHLLSRPAKIRCLHRWGNNWPITFLTRNMRMWFKHRPQLQKINQRLARSQTIDARSTIDCSLVWALQHSHSFLCVSLFALRVCTFQYNHIRNSSKCLLYHHQSEDGKPVCMKVITW